MILYNCVNKLSTLLKNGYKWISSVSLKEHYSHLIQIKTLYKFLVNQIHQNKINNYNNNIYY